MADIDVVKKRSNVWIWIIAAIVLVAIVWFVMGRDSRASATGMRTLPPASSVTAAAPVSPGTAQGV